MSTSRILLILLGAWMLAATTAMTGCSRRLTEKDLGEIQTEASQLPGTGEKYALPEPYFSKEEGLGHAGP